MRVRIEIEVDLTRADGSDPTPEEIESVLADAAAQVEEPILQRLDDGNDVAGRADLVASRVMVAL